MIARIQLHRAESRIPARCSHRAADLLILSVALYRWDIAPASPSPRKLLLQNVLTAWLQEAENPVYESCLPVLPLTGAYFKA